MIYEIGLPRRVITSKREEIKFINKYNGMKKIFRTVYNFESMNGVKPDYNSAIITKLFFDFDTEDCWNEANRLHQFLMKEDIKHHLIMSGKGYHIFVMTKSYKPINSKDCIYNAQHHFIDKLDLKCDRQVIGDNARLHRIPNTYNVKAKRFCIPITKEQFMSGDAIIKAASQHQNFITNISVGDRLFDIEKFDYKSERFSDPIFDNENFESSLNADYMNDCDDFIKRLLLKKELGWHERYLIILYFKERGFTRQEVLEIIRENLTERKFKHCVFEERQLQYLFERDDLMFPEKYCKVYK